MDDRYGWEVQTTDWLYLDCLWKTVVSKGGRLRTVYFPHRIMSGEIVFLSCV